MLRVCYVLLIFFIAMETYSQSTKSDRQPVAAGRFYSANSETLKRDLDLLFENCVKTKSQGTVRALVSPHAGYIYSGKVAASAFSSVDRNTQYKNIFVIGSSHVMAFDGASLYDSGDFITPLGKLTVNREIASKLRKEKVFSFPGNAHFQEHSLEVQMPFIQYYFKNNPMIIPIIIGTTNHNSIRKISEALRPWFTKENLFLISSDFSHYPSYSTANSVDKATADAIVSGDPEKFLATLRKNSYVEDPGLSTSMCGWTSGLLLLYLAEGQENLSFLKVDYCNSGDSKYGSRDEVVGYNAITLIEKNSDKKTEGSVFSEIKFSESEKLKEKTMVLMSYLDETKGVQLMIDAMESVLKEEPKAQLIIIGTGPYENALKEQAKRLKLENSVKFLGLMNHSELFKYIPHRRISIAPYIDDKNNYTWYADPTKPKEYLACGLPMVITNVPWVAEEVRRRPMGVVCAYNKEELAAACVKLLKDDAFYSVCLKNALDFTSELSWESIYGKALNGIKG